MRNVDRTHGDLFSRVPKLGPAVTSSIPSPEQVPGPPIELDVEDDQNLNSKYVLSGDQRKLVKTGFVEQRAARNEKVLQKRDRLPDRVQHLIDDITLLYDTAYLSVDEWDNGLVEPRDTRSKFSRFHQHIEELDRPIQDDEIQDTLPRETETDQYESPFESPQELWDELIDVSQRSQQVRDDVFFHGDSVIHPEAQFGYEIGSVLRILKPRDGSEPPGMDLLWGFLLAFIGQPKSEIDREQDVLDDVIQEMTDRHESRREDAARTPDPSEIPEHNQEYRDRIAAAIEESGFEAHPVLVRELRYHTPDLDNTQRHTSAAQGILSEITERVPLREIDELYTRIEADLEAVDSRSVRGISSARLVVEQLQRSEANAEADSTEGNGEQEGNSSSDGEQDGSTSTEHGPSQPSGWVVSRSPASIAKDLDIDTSVVQGVINRLADGRDTELWTTTPILEPKEKEGDAKNWKLTPYGTLLAHILLRKDGDPELLYWFALGPEELSLYERQMIIETLNEQELVSQ